MCIRDRLCSGEILGQIFQRPGVGGRYHKGCANGLDCHNPVIYSLAHFLNHLVGIKRGVALDLELEILDVTFLLYPFEQIFKEEDFALAHLEVLELFGLGGLYIALAAGGTVQGAVVQQHKISVAGHTYVGLETAETGLVSAVKRRLGVLVKFGTAAAMGIESYHIVLCKHSHGQKRHKAYQNCLFHRMLII